MLDVEPRPRDEPSGSRLPSIEMIVAVRSLATSVLAIGGGERQSGQQNWCGREHS
jgi:hypothetical protein